MTDSGRLSDALVIAGASAFSYALAYAYNAGFTSHFGLPPLLVPPTLGRVLQAAGAVGLVLITFWNIALPVWHFMPENTTAVSRAVRRIIRMALFIGLLAFTLFDGLSAWGAFLGVVGFFAVMELLFPLLAQRRVQGYEAKLLAQEEVEDRATQRSLFSTAHDALGRTNYLLVIAAFILLVIGRGLGANTAKTQEDYFVLADAPGYIVVAMDDNMMVLAGYDPGSLTLNGQFRIQRFSDDRQWSLKEERIGRIPKREKPKADAK